MPGSEAHTPELAALPPWSLSLLEQGRTWERLQKLFLGRGLFLHYWQMRKRGGLGTGHMQL